MPPLPDGSRFVPSHAPGGPIRLAGTRSGALHAVSLPSWNRQLMADVTSDTEVGKAPVRGTSAVDDGLVTELVAGFRPVR